MLDVVPRFLLYIRHHLPYEYLHNYQGLWFRGLLTRLFAQRNQTIHLHQHHLNDATQDCFGIFYRAVRPRCCNCWGIIDGLNVDHYFTFQSCTFCIRRKCCEFDNVSTILILITNVSHPLAKDSATRCTGPAK